MLFSTGLHLSRAYFDIKEDDCMDGVDVCGFISVCARACCAHTHWFDGKNTSLKPFKPLL